MSFIFDGIERDFEKYWSGDTRKHYKSKEIHRKILNDFLKKYCETYGSIIPKSRDIVRCVVETKQEYVHFGLKEILQALENLGKIANLMYCAERDVLIGNHVLSQRTDYPLERYYVSALEQIVWMVATFIQDDSFTDLVSRLKQLYILEEKVNG